MDRDSVLLTEAEASKAFATVFEKVLRRGKTVGEAMNAGLENMAYEEAHKLVRVMEEEPNWQLGEDGPWRHIHDNLSPNTSRRQCAACVAEISEALEAE